MPDGNDVQRAAQAKERHWPEIMAKPNVVGVGIGMKIVSGAATAEPAVVVLVRRKQPIAGLPPDGVIPPEIGGAPTDVVAVGEIRARQSHTGRMRPCPGGFSIGHYAITAGTFGCVVRDRSGRRLILSNNHVLANSNNAASGDAILQPGPTDGGQVNSDRIAVLERFVPIQFNVDQPDCNVATGVAELFNRAAQLVGSSHRMIAYRENAMAVNAVDAALARPIDPADILDEIYQIGPVNGTTSAELGMAVRKSGRTTGLTTGTINVVAATISVNYGSGRSATFENQFVAGPMSQGGDSGSLVLEAGSDRAVGLLFAGSEQTTIFNPIAAVLSALDVSL